MVGLSALHYRYFAEIGRLYNAASAAGQAAAALAQAHEDRAIKPVIIPEPIYHRPKPRQ
jgi:hypothetical protein